MKREKVATTFVDSDGEPLTDAYLMTDSDNTSGYDLFTAKAKLPYLLKRLHYKSKQLGTSLISIYGVYLRILSAGKEPKPRDMLAYPIYRMDAAGRVTTPYPTSANHNKGFPQAFAFVKGEDQDEYYHDLVEFGRVLDSLGIKLWQEDPREFDERFMGQLVVTYVASNQDFLWRGRKRDSNVLSALGTVSTSDWGRVAIGGSDSSVRGFVSRLLESDAVKRVLDAPVPEQLLNAFFKFYALVTKDTRFIVDADTYMGANPQAAYTEDPQVPTYACLMHFGGFLCLPGSTTPYVFDVSKICRHVANAVAVLHKSGSLWIITDAASVYTIPLTLAAQYLQACMRGQSGGGQWNSLVM